MEHSEKITSVGGTMGESRVTGEGQSANGREMDMEITVNELARAFSEWDRRYREDPEAFLSEASHLLQDTPESYGEEVAPYFVEILNEFKGDETAKKNFLAAKERERNWEEWSEGYTVGYNQGYKTGKK